MTRLYTPPKKNKEDFRMGDLLTLFKVYLHKGQVAACFFSATLPWKF